MAVRMFDCPHLLHRVCLIDYITNSNYGCSSRCPSCRREFQENVISERIQWSDDTQDNNSEDTPLGETQELLMGLQTSDENLVAENLVNDNVNEDICTPRRSSRIRRPVDRFDST